MKSIKEFINHVKVTMYTYRDIAETSVILHDTDSDFVCVGTNGDPVCYDSYDEFEGITGDDMVNYNFGAEYNSITDYLADHGMDISTLDDEDILDELRSDFGIGEAKWLEDLAADAE